MPWRSPRPWLVLLAASGCVFLLSACGGGGGDDSAGGTKTTETTAATETEAKRQIDPADQKRADAMVLQLSDFPTGWRGTPSKKEKSDSPECFKLDAGGVVLTGRRESDGFSTGSTTTASSLGAVYESVADAETIYKQISDGRLADCFADYMKKQSDKEATITDVTVGQLSFPKVGAASDARQIVIEVKANDADMTLNGYVDLVAIRNERAVTFLFFLDILTPFSPEQEAELATKVATRMAPV